LKPERIFGVLNGKVKKKIKWQGYDSSDTDEYITEHFTEKYGYEPAEINRDKPACVLVGPIKEIKE